MICSFTILRPGEELKVHPGLEAVIAVAVAVQDEKENSSMTFKKEGINS